MQGPGSPGTDPLAWILEADHAHSGASSLVVAWISHIPNARSVGDGLSSSSIHEPWASVTSADGGVPACF